MVICLGNSATFAPLVGGPKLQGPQVAGILACNGRSVCQTGEPVEHAVHIRSSSVLVKLFLSKWQHTLSDGEREVLGQLGFAYRPGLSDRTPAERDNKNYPYDYASKNHYAKNYVKQKVEKYAAASLVHCCSEVGNLLSKPYSRGELHVNFVDITEQDDFTSERAVAHVISTIKGPGDMFFFCYPCTGGSAWQRLNLAKAKLHGCMFTVWKLIGR